MDANSSIRWSTVLDRQMPDVQYHRTYNRLGDDYAIAENRTIAIVSAVDWTAENEVHSVGIATNQMDNGHADGND